MVVTANADGSDADELWRALATPAAWPRWAPHICATTMVPGPPGRTVRTGDVVRIDSLGPSHVTAAITRVDAPHRWDFQVDLPLGNHVEAAHEVLNAPTAVRVTMTVRGPLPGPVAGTLLAAYRPVAAYALRRLVALARRGAG